MADRVLMFEGVGVCFYTVADIRPPKAGEFYLSGAIVTAYKAYRDYPPSAAYQIVVPTHLACPVQAYVRGAALDARGRRVSA